MEQIIHFSGSYLISYVISKGAVKEPEAEANVEAIRQANEWLKKNASKIEIKARSLATSNDGFVHIMFSYITK